MSHDACCPLILVVLLLGGTAGQADPGVLSGGPYTLGGGFWRGGVAAAPVHRVYLPLVSR